MCLHIRLKLPLYNICDHLILSSFADPHTYSYKLLIERASAPTFKNFPSFHRDCHQLQSHDTCSFFDSDEEAGAVGNHVLKVDCFSDGACGSI